jgi:peroxiredoxin
MKLKIQNIQSTLWILLTVAIICIASCTKKTPQQTKEMPAENATAKTPFRASLNDVISHRRQWKPILTNWYEKDMPDFSVTDINGKTHKLSNYKGKNVMIALWATWCVPCQQEIPHLIALEKIINRDNLPAKILAISNENPVTIKNFVKLYNLNYTVILNPGTTLPKPISLTEFIPTSFFVDPQGKIKLIIEGSGHLSELKTILLAE